MMPVKRVLNKFVLALLICILFLISSCGKSANTRLQEQLNLGKRYLSEQNYDGAIKAFTAAIKIDPNTAAAYAGRGDAYVGLARSGKETDNTDYANAENDYNKAIELDPANADTYLKLADVCIVLGEPEKAASVLQQGYDKTHDARLQEKFLALSPSGKKETTSEETAVSKAETTEAAMSAAETTKAAESINIDELQIPFTIDNLTFGKSTVSEAKSTYGGRKYINANPMTDTKTKIVYDTVYILFGNGKNSMPTPEGYKDMEFGLLFEAPSGTETITNAEVQDPSILCMNAFHVGDPASAAVKLFGLEDLRSSKGKIDTDNGKGCTLEADFSDPDNFGIYYQKGNQNAHIKIVNNVIHRVRFLNAE